MNGIRAGRIDEATRDSGDWVFVDTGFAQDKTKSCGLLKGDDPPIVLTFSELREELINLCSDSKNPLNLVIEAPLSVSFSRSGNPTGRSIERRGNMSRYWYVGLGCSVLISATYLVRSLTNTSLSREIRLFEGFVSFKQKGTASNHREDVQRLKDIIWGLTGVGSIVSPNKLTKDHTCSIESAFAVSGMDYGIPPVIMVNQESNDIP